MTITAVSVGPTWATSTPHVRKALRWLKAKGDTGATASELVAWDATHGRRLFTWEDAEAAEQYRLHEARCFLNRFRARIDGYRVRTFVHLREDAAAGIDRDAYYTTETIAASPGMREQVMRDIRRRMASLASEMRLWHLGDAELTEILEALAEAMTGAKKYVTVQQAATQ